MIRATVLLEARSSSRTRRRRRRRAAAAPSRGRRARAGGASRSARGAWRRPASALSRSVITRMAVSTLGRSHPGEQLADLAVRPRVELGRGRRGPRSVSADSCRRASAAERCLVTRPSASNRLSTRLRYPASMSRARRRSDTSRAVPARISYSSRALGERVRRVQVHAVQHADDVGVEAVERPHGRDLPSEILAHGAAPRVGCLSQRKSLTQATITLAPPAHKTRSPGPHPPATSAAASAPANPPRGSSSYQFRPLKPGKSDSKRAETDTKLPAGRPRSAERPISC